MSIINKCKKIIFSIGITFITIIILLLTNNIYAAVMPQEPLIVDPYPGIFAERTILINSLIVISIISVCSTLAIFLYHKKKEFTLLPLIALLILLCVPIYPQFYIYTLGDNSNIYINSFNTLLTNISKIAGTDFASAFIKTIVFIIVPLILLISSLVYLKKSTKSTKYKILVITITSILVILMAVIALIFTTKY